jgi:protein-disulfide isomerase
MTSKHPQSRNIFKTIFLRATSALLVSALYFGLSVPAFAIDEAEQADIEAIIHNYLVENPEILEEMISALKNRDSARAETTARREIAANRDAIFNPGASFVAGNPVGDVTLVEFFDYTCSFCKQSLKDVQRRIKEDPGLRVVFIDYPALSDRNPTSMVATRASIAAAQQGKYWPFHLKLMGSATGLTSKNITRYAGEVGLDVERLLKDMNAQETYRRIDSNIELANRLGIDGTPSFVIGDQIMAGARGHTVLKHLIARQRANNK